MSGERETIPPLSHMPATGHIYTLHTACHLIFKRRRLVLSYVRSEFETILAYLRSYLKKQTKTPQSPPCASRGEPRGQPELSESLACFQPALGNRHKRISGSRVSLGYRGRCCLTHTNTREDIVSSHSRASVCICYLFPAQLLTVEECPDTGQRIQSRLWPSAGRGQPSDLILRTWSQHMRELPW